MRKQTQRGKANAENHTTSLVEQSWDFNPNNLSSGLFCLSNIFIFNFTWLPLSLQDIILDE